jgi:ketosteroid isomerase-like protein
MSNAEQEAILAANQSFYRAFEKRDLEAMSAIWSQGVTSLCIHPGRKVLKGWDAIYQSWEQIFQATDYIEIEIEIVGVDRQPPLAYVVLVEKVLQVTGRRRIESQTTATNIFEFMGSTWYLVHHHGSPLLR